MKKGLTSTRMLLVTCMLFLICACAKERDVKSVLPNGRRIQKSILSGTFVYLKALKSAEYPGNHEGADAFTGMYQDTDKLVQFVVKENSLDVVSIDPLYTKETAIQANRLVASFPVKHVDILRKKNEDDQDTHIEEETETRRPWQEREYVVVDIANDFLDELGKDKQKSAGPGDRIEHDPNAGVINFEVTKHLKDDTLVTQGYSFLKFTQAFRTYAQREYSRAHQERFGLFKTVTYQLDAHGRPTIVLRKEFINRWDLSKKVVYYLSKDFPDYLKSATRAVFDGWNKAFQSAAGHEVLELRENTHQELGDLRYNLITYDTSTSGKSLLGYGPSVTNPRTGEIVKADVILYGGTLKRVLFGQGILEELLGPSGGGSSSSIALTRGSAMPMTSAFLTASLDLLPTQPSMKISKTLDLELLAQIRDEFKDHRFLKALKENFANETCLAGEVEEVLVGLSLAATADPAAVAALSDEQLEQIIFIPLMSHEIGHNLGLRHNFMGSADGAHFAPDSKSSSVMDYLFLAKQEPMKPGPYDVATIQFAYGNGNVDELMAKNFLYCTDEHTFDSRRGLCNQFDAGTNMSEVVDSLFNRYVASYHLNNRLLGRVRMSVNQREYLGRIWRYLTPIRLIMDHATILDWIGADYAQSRSVEETRDALWLLWYFLGKLIEVDETPTKLPYPLEISKGQSIMVDLEKVKKVLDDARTAKVSTFESLSAIITDQRRQAYDIVDPFHGELILRGVIWDRMISLILLAEQFPNPQSSGFGISPFVSMRTDVGNLFASLLSDVAFHPLVGLIEGGFDVNLRELALDLLRDRMIPLGGTMALSRELVSLRKPVGEQTKLVRQIHQYQNQEIEARVGLSQPDLTPERKTELVQTIRQARQSRSEINLVTVNIEGVDMVVPLSLEALGFDTATGLLIAVLINPGEMEISLNEALIEDLAAKIQTETDADKKATLKKRQAELRKKILERQAALAPALERLNKYYRVYNDLRSR